jgi:hypothetical protein
LTAIALLLAIPLLAVLLVRPASEPEDLQSASEPIADPTEILPDTPAAARLIDRAELISAAGRASRALGSPEPPPAENIRLAGQRFALYLPFGCDGSAPADADLPPNGWSYDPETGTLRGQVTAEVWTDTPWAQVAAGGQPFEGAEGFWIDRPWSKFAGCLSAAPKAGLAAPSPQTIGIARFSDPESTRSAKRDGQAYRFSKKVAPEDVPGNEGLRLVVEGRLSVDPSRQPVGCWSEHPDVRPICIFNVRFDRIAITDASGKTTFAEWKD